jgi:hypothetical protein
MADPSGEPDVVDQERPGRRAAAIVALCILPVVALLLLFVIVDNLRLVVSLVVAFAVFFAGAWGALSRHEWWRWVSAGVGAVGALAALVLVVGIGWVSTGTTVAIFLLCGAFAGLTRYALGDRVELDP